MGTHNEHHANQEEIARIIRIKAKRLVHHPAFEQDDVEDIQQDLQLHWLERRTRYDPEKSALHTFANIVLNNKIRNMLAERKAAKRDYRRRVVSLEEPASDHDEEKLSYHDLYSQDDYFRETGCGPHPELETPGLAVHISRVLQTLSPELKRLAVRLRTQTVAEAACEMKVPRATLYGWKANIREAFAGAGLEDYLTRLGQKENSTRHIPEASGK